MEGKPGVSDDHCLLSKVCDSKVGSPESRSMDVETDAREVREVSLTWMLREQGEFFNRT